MYFQQLDVFKYVKMIVVENAASDLPKHLIRQRETWQKNEASAARDAGCTQAEQQKLDFRAVRDCGDIKWTRSK